MKIQFCGAAQAVTGSAHLITLDDGYTILLDCGLYQGSDKDFADFNRSWLFQPRNIDCVILSHAHIDHSGRLPYLSRSGFTGEIICTHATRDLAAIMLMDSAYIQERDAAYLNKRKGRYAHGYAEPLYTPSDVPSCLNLFCSIGYDKWHKINNRVEVYMRDAGHILGSANVTLRIRNGKHEKVIIGFTGDIGRPDRPILRDPQPMPECDYLITESTYGDKLHQAPPAEEDKLLQIIRQTCIKKRGKLIIPAFSIGRTQEIVYMLDRLETQGRLPRNIPVYVDSPLAINATHIFRQHPECFDNQLLDYMVQDPNPFGFSKLHYTRKVEQSKALNSKDDPCVIISASGMITAGRIKHHVANNIDDPKNTILIVGYCTPQTLGGRLRAGVEEIGIFGMRKPVKAEITIMDSFSAHGDQREMLDFMDNQDRKRLNNLFLVHGELPRQQTFRDVLLDANFRNVNIPELGQTFNIW